MFREPTGLTIGQLSECLDNLRSMRSNDAVISFGLVWLGEPLRATGAQGVR